MFVLRPAQSSDLPDLILAAHHLDSVNLPNDETRLSESIARSLRSFAATLSPEGREFMFVLVDESTTPAKVIGSSMIFAQHGSRHAPHIFFDVIDEERYSETIDRHFHHQVLRLGSNYQGMTEIGGLVLLPAYRGHAEKLGKSLLMIRFLYIALHRSIFCDEMVSELMPPLQDDGTSLLWESLGRHFTGLSYQEADQLSRRNKEFIRTLFPQDPIYASLLPTAAQKLIGQVGPHTKGVEMMLRKAGFEYAHRIDPFDGGPHFHAKTDAVVPIVASRRVPIVAIENALGAPQEGDDWALVVADRTFAPYFVATRTRIAARGDGIAVSPTTADHLGLSIGDIAGVLPV